MFTTHLQGPKQTTAPVEVYLACDPAVTGNALNTPAVLAAYLQGKGPLAPTEGASPILLAPLTASQVEAVRQAANDRCPDSYLGAVIKSRFEGSDALKDARLAEPEAPGSLARCQEEYILGLTADEREAYEQHLRYLAAFGQEFAFASIVPEGFPFQNPDGTPYKCTSKADLRARIEAIRPLPVAKAVIDEIQIHAFRLTYLGEEKKG